ncbi:MAG: acyl-CoA dehydrogenase family protein, partial [Sphingomonadaceae bacterium]|nr:acyl-CoA dehydrogenase family protein [Sphingomonadaceae bacterium]
MRFATALEAAEAYRDAAKAALVGRLLEQSIEADQRAAHGFAWVATSVAALGAVHYWLDSNGGGTQLDQQIASLIFTETLGQLTGGLPMGQNEIFRPIDLGTNNAAQSLAQNCASWLHTDQADTREAVAQALAEGQMPSESLHDAELDAIRDQYRRFTTSEILPHAHKWHLANDLIPDATIADMAALGTFGVCIPAEYGGLGLSKLVMCVVTEELSRGWIGAGSLSTRSEIAGELISMGGTEAQRTFWLPKIVSGEILPNAVFTEPDTGSDLGALQTRARRDNGNWIISGAKTWITHASRSDLMTML